MNTLKSATYKEVKNRLIELKEMIGKHQNFGEGVNKILRLIFQLENVNKADNEERLKLIEAKLALKNEVEKLKAKIDMKELEYQKLKESFDYIKNQGETKVRTKFMEMRSKLIEYVKIENKYISKEEKELMNKLVNDLATWIKDYSLNALQKESDSEELSKLSLSQREKILFNYMQEPESKDDLRDVCLENLLEITGRSYKTIKDYSTNEAKLERMMNCVSATDLAINGFNNSIILLDTSIDKGNDQEKDIIRRMLNEPEKEKVILNTKAESAKSEIKNNNKRLMQNEDDRRVEEKSYEDQYKLGVNLRNEILSYRVKRLKRVVQIESMNPSRKGSVFSFRNSLEITFEEKCSEE